MNNFYLESLYAQKIADMTCVPVEYILKLRDRQFLNETKVRNTLIVYDYELLKRTGKFTREQLCEKIGGIYNINPSSVGPIISQKSKRVFYCKNCGRIIPSKEHKQNEGICTRCIAKSIIV